MSVRANEPLGLMRVGVALAAAALVGACQLRAPAAFEPLPGPRAEVLRRFALDHADQAHAPLAPIHVLGRSGRADDEATDAPFAEIELNDVLRAVETHFPLVLAALEEVEIAESKLQQSRGSFDTRLGATGAFDLEGFYEADTVDIGIEQPLEFWGLNVSSGYRIGRGDFAVYDGKRKTNKDGEWRLGVSMPLLAGREIDARRVSLWRARLVRDAAAPLVIQKRLEATLKAAQSYWKWVAAGRRREIAVRLLALAEDRMAQIELAVQEGLLAAINLTENQRLIVDRRAALLRAERSLQEAALTLSLFWRDERGQPATPRDELLPYEFPMPRAAADVLRAEDEELALAQRPELRLVEVELERLQLELELARNDVLPRLDAGVFGSQDLGGAVSTPDDKEPFELTALLRFQLPLQRNLARGQVRESEAKLRKLTRERQFLVDALRNEVRDVSSALTQTWLRIAQAEENVRLANELAQAERVQLDAGQSDLLRVNLREQQAAAAAGGLVDVYEEYFRALAQYRAALGLPYDEVAAGAAVGGAPVSNER